MNVSSLTPAIFANRFVVILSEIRPLPKAGRRDELTYPERRRQVAKVDTAATAATLAHAFVALGMVRAGRQRVRVLSLGRHNPASSLLATKGADPVAESAEPTCDP